MHREDDESIDILLRGLGSAQRIGGMCDAAFDRRTGRNIQRSAGWKAPSRSYQSSCGLALVAARLLLLVSCRVRSEHLHEDSECHTLPCNHSRTYGRIDLGILGDAGLHTSLCGNLHVYRSMTSMTDAHNHGLHAIGADTPLHEADRSGKR